MLAPVNEPVPTTNSSVLSSKPINALSESPLSKTIPISLDGEPVVPLPNSISLSDTTVFVVFKVFVVPLTVKLPVTVKSAANVALPAADISKVSAVTSEPPSLPLKTISLSDTADLITKSLDEFVNLPISVPPSFIITSAPSASKLISPEESNVKPLELI